MKLKDMLVFRKPTVIKSFNRVNYVKISSRMYMGMDAVRIRRIFRFESVKSF